MEHNKRNLVIIGGGFAGLEVAKRVDKRRWNVRIIDRNNYHSFAPLFYQVASSALEPASVTFPLRREVRRHNVRGCYFDMGTVTGIDVVNKVVHTDSEDVAYDKVVIAAGTVNNFFGMEGLDRRVYTLKSVGEAIRCRNAILGSLERAAVCHDEAERRALLTFVVVGGGPAGVEIAGALGEMKRYVIKRDYPRISPDEVRVVLCEGGDRVLAAMSEQSSVDARRDLEHLLVEVRTGARMQSYDGRTMAFADGSTIDAEVVIWTAGVVGASIPLVGTDVKQGRGGRFEVDEYNQVIGVDDVYAIGDISRHVDEENPAGCPQMARPAIEQGKRLAQNLNDPLRRRPFRYRSRGVMATIGRNSAVVDIGSLHFGGWFAWITWMGVHLMSLLGMRNKAVVMLNWIWSYWGYSTSLRLLLRPERLPDEKK